ncbi:MAG: molybdate ABC transporter permease subunit [Anaerolineales bacterium]|jgi:molybdate transport system permease protein|nr:molybdate ABC transporter permease subunit [Anaerolineales bacterium]
MQWSPLTLSLWISLWSGLLALVAGVWFGWLLAKRSFPGKLLLEGLILLPLVLPPTVLGYYLLSALGARGLGPWIEQAFGFRLVFSWRGAVIAAAIAALPLVVQTARAGFAETSAEIEDAARVDGCSERQLFWLIDLPIAWRSIMAGGLLGLLRALGEFGATLMVAGNIPGQTQTLSMAVYDAVQANNLTRANQLTLLLSATALGFLYLSLLLNRRISGNR